MKNLKQQKITSKAAMDWILNYKYSSLLVGGLAVGVSVGIMVCKMNWLLRNVATAINPYKLKMVFVVRSDLGMGKGKIASQCAHAAIQCYKVGLKSQEKQVLNWLSSGQAKVVLKVSSESELKDVFKKANEAGICTSLIRDAGKTQLDSGTATVLGIGPAEVEKLDSITGHLKLL